MNFFFPTVKLLLKRVFIFLIFILKILYSKTTKSKIFLELWLNINHKKYSNRINDFKE